MKYQEVNPLFVRQILDNLYVDDYYFCVKLLTSMHCNGLKGKW